MVKKSKLKTHKQLMKEAIASGSGVRLRISFSHCRIRKIEPEIGRLSDVEIKKSNDRIKRKEMFTKRKRLKIRGYYEAMKDDLGYII